MSDNRGVNWQRGGSSGAKGEARGSLRGRSAIRCRLQLASLLVTSDADLGLPVEVVNVDGLLIGPERIDL